MQRWSSPFPEVRGWGKYSMAFSYTHTDLGCLSCNPLCMVWPSWTNPSNSSCGSVPCCVSSLLDRLCTAAPITRQGVYLGTGLLSVSQNPDWAQPIWEGEISHCLPSYRREASSAPHNEELWAGLCHFASDSDVAIRCSEAVNTFHDPGPFWRAG